MASCLLAVAAWAGLGSVAAIVLCGRNWLSSLAFVLPLVAVSGLLIADFADFDLLGHLSHAGPALVVPLGVLLPLAAAAAWALAVRRSLIPARAATLAALFWAARRFCCCGCCPRSSPRLLVAGEPLPRWLLAVAPGLAAAVVLPPALAPLALRWNRHR